jgi:arylsulfatase A-like enzyme
MVLSLLFCWAALAMSAQDAGEATTKKSPEAGLNIVLIVADDLGSGDLGCYGGSIPTPHIDALAKSGVRFTQAYATAASCGPSRAAFLTGKHQVGFGFEFNIGPTTRGAAITAAQRDRGLPVNVVTLPERLRKLEYTTGMVGKWHLGLRNDAHPLERGFQEFFGFLDSSHPYLPGSSEGRGDALFRNSAKVKPSGYLTDTFARESADFVKAHAKEPFFLYAAFNAPHKPYEASEKYLERFPNLEGDQRVYAAMVSAFDDGVGLILAGLEEAGIAERTLVVLMSDHGAVADAGEGGAGSNGGLRLGKFFLFEGGLRVPLIVRDPTHARAGAVVETPVSTLDIAPTLLRAAGADVAGLGLDGIDLAPLLDGANDPARGGALAWRSGVSAALRLGDFKVIRSETNVWLYDLRNDPGELRDLSGTRIDELELLLGELGGWISRMPEPLWPGTTRKEPTLVDGKPYRVVY